MIGAQARGREFDVAHELLRRFVVVRPAVVGRPQALPDLGEKDAVRHPVVPGRGELAGPRQQDVVFRDPGLEFAARGHAARALRELVRERAAFLEVGRDDALVLAMKRLANRLRVNLRVAVHVAADPAAETEHQRHAVELGRHSEDRLHPEPDLLVERGHDAIDDFREIEQHVLALVADGQPLARMRFRLPARGDLHADALPDGALLERRQRRIEPLDHQVGDLLLLAEHRPARGLGRMRREHGIDRDARQQFEHFRGVEARRLQAVHAVADAAGLRPVAVGKVLAPAAHAVHALGQVHDLEPGAECADQVARLGRLAARGSRDEVHRAAGIAAAPRDCRDAIAFDALEQLIAALVAQHVADQPAEGVHVLA